MARALARRGVGIVVILALVGEARAADAPKEPFVELAAETAKIHGDTARFLVLEGIGTVCYWTDPTDWLSWDFALEEPGDYVVDLKHSCEPGSRGSAFDVTVGDSRLSGRVAEDTGSWYDHATVKLGSVTVSRAGEQRLTLKPTGKPGQAVMNLAWIRLVPAARYAEYEARKQGRELGWRGEFTGPVLVVPNFHPASCGWLTDFSTERNYCAYSYLAHLDRVRDDPTYCFALSEVNTILAILEVDLEKPERIARAFLSEAYDRVRSFEIQYEDAGQWKTAARGGAIGLELEVRFEEITAQKVRLRILDAPGGPTIWEFLLFPPKP